MRSQGGSSGSKRKAETNFVNAYSGASELAPPPSSRDVLAVPSKLRKIMRLKSLMTEGSRPTGHADQRAGRGSEKKTMKVAKKSSGGKNVKDVGVNGSKEINLKKQSTGPELDSGIPDQSTEKKKSSFASKWKKGEEELKRLVEKMDKREKTGIRTAVSDRRKSFLNEKKKKRKGGLPDADSLPAMNQYDKVEFGDIVQAPPKLSFPRKAAEVSAMDAKAAVKTVSIRGGLNSYALRHNSEYTCVCLIKTESLYTQILATLETATVCPYSILPVFRRRPQGPSSFTGH